MYFYDSNFDQNVLSKLLIPRTILNISIEIQWKNSSAPFLLPFSSLSIPFSHIWAFLIPLLHFPRLLSLPLSLLLIHEGISPKVPRYPSQAQRIAYSCFMKVSTYEHFLRILFSSLNLSSAPFSSSFPSHCFTPSLTLSGFSESQGYLYVSFVNSIAHFIEKSLKNWPFLLAFGFYNLVHVGIRKIPNIFSVLCNSPLFVPCRSIWARGNDQGMVVAPYQKRFSVPTVASHARATS